MFVDMPLDQLREYRPALPEPPDFDGFWERTLTEARKHELDPVFTPVDTGLSLVDCWDVEFSGFGGHRIKGWLIAPAGAQGPLPCVMQYIGYNGGRGRPHQWLLWPSAGRAVLVMDSRGQGTNGYLGDTPDPVGGTGATMAGRMTQGVHDPEEHYYRRLYTDGVRAVEAARSHPLIDPERIVASGGSQGAAIALAVTALAPGLQYSLLDVPFMAHIRRAVEITPDNPYGEVGRFLASQRHLVDQAFTTLDHFDGLNFATRARTPALFSVGLRDGITPASTVFAAYNHYAGPKDIRVWPFNGHEGGEAVQIGEQLKLMSSL